MNREDTLMERTRATVAYLNGKPRQDEDAEMWAFLSLFHPEMTDIEKRSFIRDTHERGGDERD